MMKQLIAQMTLDAVKQELRNTVLGQVDPYDRYAYIDGKCFADQVAYRTEKMNMSVNEIVAEFKRLNGIN